MKKKSNNYVNCHKIEVVHEMGVFTIVEKNHKIIRLYFPSDIVPNEIIFQEQPELLEAKKQLEEYFSGTRSVFELALYVEGTSFQEKVWNALMDIPYGKLRSYKDIANIIDHPKAYRAVGGANHNNPIPIFIPCHRVIADNGALSGFGGGLNMKKFLIALEKHHKK